MAEIVIVCDDPDRFRTTPYILRSVENIWRTQGHVLALRKDPPSKAPDLAIAHVDLTVLRAAFLARLQRLPVTLNAHVDDISKRALDVGIVDGPDGHDGPVIVKTNSNCGGTPELLAMARSGAAGWLRAKALQRLPWALSGYIRSADYPIYDHPRHVPALVWRNPRLVVQKLALERHGALFALRQWTFLGDASDHTLALAPTPVIKAASVVHREPIPEPPPESVRAIRARLGFDYGKFDYAISGGEAVVFDVNRTPTFGKPDSPGARATADVLAQGLTGVLSARKAA